jgi:hypothetical protein
MSEDKSPRDQHAQNSVLGEFIAESFGYGLVAGACYLFYWLAHPERWQLHHYLIALAVISLVACYLIVGWRSWQR